MTYRQLSPRERYMLAALRRQGYNKRRSRAPRPPPFDGLPRVAPQRHPRRRPLSGELRPRSGRTGAAPARAATDVLGRGLALVEELLCRQWTPSRSRPLRRTGQLAISHETIYRHVLAGQARGRDDTRTCAAPAREGVSATALTTAAAGWRQAHALGAASRGRGRREAGHGEIDTVMGTGSKDCIVSLVERKTACS